MTEPADHQRLVRDVLVSFDMEHARVDPLRRTNNEVYSVEADGGRFVLRLHRAGHRSPEHTRDELTLLEAVAPRLASVGVDVPRPVRSTSGHLIAHVPGPDRTTHASVLTWVGGTSLRPGAGLGPVGARLLGETLAHLHLIMASAARDLGLVFPVWNASSMFTEASPFCPGSLDDLIPAEYREVFNAGVERATAAFEELDSSGDQQAVIHFDFILLNCRLQRGRGWRPGVIDFDDVGSGYWLYDLAPLIDNLLDFPKGAPLADAFCAGYNSVQPLPPRWPELLTALMGGRQIVSALWAAGMGRRTGNHTRAAELIDIRLQKLHRYVHPVPGAWAAVSMSS